MANYYYQVGGSLNRYQPSYVKRDADAAIVEALKKGEFCYVLNSRQMGKSSLRVRAMQRLKKDGLRCASIDVTKIGNHFSPEAWYKGFADELLRVLSLDTKVNLKSWWLERDTATPVQRLGQLIEEVLLTDSSAPLAIFIDEIDSTIQLGEVKDDFFAFIRSCYNQRVDNDNYENLTFCLLGVATPSDLIADKTRTPFNIGTAIELTGFTFAEAKEALTPGLAGKVDDPEATLQQILDWTGGQPFLTQKLCDIVADFAEGSSPYIPQLVERYVINNWEGQDNPEHLRTIRDRVLRKEEKAGRLLGLYQGVLLRGEVAIDSSLEQMELRLSGLVVKRDEKLMVYNEIYRAVFDRDWVEKELEKLRPYSEAIALWEASGCEDESQLLRGQELLDAQKWAAGKSLSDLDYRFLAACQKLQQREVEEALAIKEKESEILAEANQTLAEAQRKANFRIRVGTTILVVSLVGAIIAGILATRYFQRERAALIGARLEQEGANILRQFQPDSREEAQVRVLISAIQIGQELKSLVGEDRPLETYPATSPLLALQNILDGMEPPEHKIVLEAHEGAASSVSFSPDGKILATAGRDGMVRVWNLSGELQTEWQGDSGAIESIGFRPDGEILATAGQGGMVRLWNLSGELQREWQADRDLIARVSFSPDGELLATAGGEGVRLWNQSGELVRQFSGHIGIVASASFSADGQMLAAVDGYGKVIVWNLSGTKLFKLEVDNSIMSAGFSSDGERLATAELDGRVRIWNKSGEQLAEFDAYQDQLRHIGFNSDRQHVATVGTDGIVKLWNVAGRQIAEFEGTDKVSRVSFSPDGRHVAATTGSGVVWLRRVEGLDELLARGCRLLEGYRDRYPETTIVCIFSQRYKGLGI